jgi:hypothetical protein
MPVGNFPNTGLECGMTSKEVPLLGSRGQWWWDIDSERIPGAVHILQVPYAMPLWVLDWTPWDPNHVALLHGSLIPDHGEAGMMGMGWGE